MRYAYNVVHDDLGRLMSCERRHDAAGIAAVFDRRFDGEFTVEHERIDHDQPLARISPVLGL